VEVKTEADDSDESSHDEQPTTGVFGLYGLIYGCPA